MTLSKPLSPALRMLSRLGADRGQRMLLPNTIVIGAQKAGTTWIHRRLAEHPDAFMTEQKEVNFFLGGSNAETLAEYSGRFAGSENAVVRGESTPGYFWTPRGDDPKQQSTYGRAADWVRKICGPDVRLIVSLRDPVARAVSAHYHHFRAGRFPANRSILRSGDAGSLMDIGRYSRHWAYWRERFEADNFLIFTLEGIRRDHGGTCAALYAALGLSPMSNPRSAKPENAGFRLEWDGKRIRAVPDAKNPWNRRFEEQVARAQMPTVSRSEIEDLIGQYSGEYPFMNSVQDRHVYEPTVEAVIRSLGLDRPRPASGTSGP